MSSSRPFKSVKHGPGSHRFDEAQDILNQAKDLLESAGAGADMEVWATVHTNLGGILLSKGRIFQSHCLYLVAMGVSNPLVIVLYGT